MPRGCRGRCYLSRRQHVQILFCLGQSQRRNVRVCHNVVTLRVNWSVYCLMATKARPDFALMLFSLRYRDTWCWPWFKLRHHRLFIRQTKPTDNQTGIVQRRSKLSGHPLPVPMHARGLRTVVSSRGRGRRGTARTACSMMVGQKVFGHKMFGHKKCMVERSFNEVPSIKF